MSMTNRDSDWAEIGRRLKARRQELGLSQPAVRARLAEHGIAVDKSMISRWEDGVKIAEPRYLFALETVLELEPGSISHLAGYQPAGARPKVRAEEAIAEDETLSEEARGLLLAAVRAARKFERR